MTPIFFMVVYLLGLGAALFRHPIYGLYTYLFTFYMSPESMWWRSAVPDLRYLFIAALVALAATLRLPADDKRPPWYKTGAGKLMLAFVIYNWLQYFWAVNPNLQIEGATLYSKHLVAFYLFYRLADSNRNVIALSLVHIVGCAYFGYLALGASGGRLESVGGPVAGSNELGVHVSSGILFGALLFLSLAGTRRWLIVGCMPLIVNTLVLTLSRGSFLGLAAGGVFGYLSSPRHLRKRYLGASLLGLVLFGMLAHEPLLERFTATFEGITQEEADLDNSAASRVEIALAGLAIARDHPLGAGYRSTAILSPKYMDERLLSRSKGQRAAHNSSAAVIAEHGLPGLIIYYLTIFWALRTAMRVASGQPDGDPDLYGALGCMLGASLFGIYVSCNFSNNVDLETQYWCLALLASVYELSRHRAGETQTSTPARELKPPPLGAVAGRHVRTRVSEDVGT